MNEYKSIFFKSRFFVVMALAIFTNAAMAQTEGNGGTTQTNDTNNYYDYYSDYAVDTLKYLPMLDVNINQKTETDSLIMGQKYVATLDYVNNENKDIVIKEVVASCGCISLEWISQVIPPGGTGWIKINYTATIPDKIYTSGNILIYNGNQTKPLAVQPISISANTKYLTTN